MFRLDGSVKVKKELISSADDDEYVPEETVLRAKLPTLVCSLDFQQICSVFMVLLSQRYINENAAPEFKITRPLTVELLVNMFAMASKMDNKTAYTKEVIGILESVQLHEVSDVETLRVLWYQANQAVKRFIKQQPKLTKFIAAVKVQL